MAKVEINAGGRYVLIEQDGRDAELLMPLAEKAWLATEGAKRPSEPAIGFRDERRWTPDTDEMSPGSRGFSTPVKAEGGVSANPV